MSLSHSFSVQYAELYGIECAILINHFQFWIEQNQATGKNFHDGRTWMYQTQKEISAVYPYWSEDTVYRLLKKLEDDEVLIKGNYNKTSFDKTAWYAFKNEKMFTKPRNRGIETAKSQNPLREVAEPIPDTNTDTRKIQQQPAAVFPKQSAQKVHGCLQDVNIPETEKVQISKTYDESTVRNAVAFATHPSVKINKDLTAAIKWACKEKPLVPKNALDEAESNKAAAKEIALKCKKSNTCKFEMLNDRVEIVFLTAQKDPICLSYYDKGFKDQLLGMLKKTGLL